MTKFVVQATWSDSPHLSPEAQEELGRSFLPHERDARIRGVPSLGSGAIYPVSESDITVAPFPIPHFWKLSYGLDVGWNRTAAIWAATDTETGVSYLVSEHYRAHAEPPIHAAAIKSRGSWIPGVVDPAARGRGQKDGEQLLAIYKQLGLLLTNADNSLASGIYEVWTALSEGRLKIFATLVNWFAEYRIYRRDDKGAIVKENDHLMDATRYLILSGLKSASFRPPELVRSIIRPRKSEEWSPQRALERDGYGSLSR